MYKKNNFIDSNFILKVFAVVVSHEPTGDLSPAAVSYTSGFYQIPVIGISSRDAAFSDKNIHVSFLRTVPPYYHQADVWLEMLNHFQYTKVTKTYMNAISVLSIYTIHLIGKINIDCLGFYI